MNDSDENTSLRKENEDLKRDLKESTLQLAALAHKEYQVPDGSIRDDYQKICRAIETWIDYASSDEPGDFRNRYREVLKSEDKTHKLRDLGIEYQRPAISDVNLNSLKNLDMLHHYILSLTITKHIFYGIIMKRYPIGTTESQQVTFSSIEEEMLRIGKAKSKKNQWKSDTLTALCASRSFKTERENQLSQLLERLEKDLLFWLESSSSSKHRSRLRREIFNPAVKLHLEMQCSTQQYELIISRRDFQFEPSSSGEQTLSYNMKDIMTWKTIASDGTEDNLQCIYPGLVAYDMEAENKSELVKPVMAVDKRSFPPQAKRSSTSSARASSQRTDSQVKELRDPKHQKLTTSMAKSTRFASHFGLSRKSGDSNRSSPESKSHTGRRPSRELKQIQYPAPSHDQVTEHSSIYQTEQAWPMQVSSSTNTFPPPEGNIQQHEGITVEVEDEEPEEMSYSTGFTEWQIDDNHGRANVSDDT